MELVPGPPDFLGLGAARSGGAWWYGLLARHPRFHETVGRSPAGLLATHFEHDADDVDVIDLHARFARPAGAFTGEWSSSYLAYAWLGPLLARVAPRGRFLVLLRDPIDRYLSELTVERAALRRSGRPRFQQRLQPHEDARAYGRGFYAEWLALLERSVPRERVLVLQYEQCLQDPARELARTLDFLELEPFTVDVTATRRESRATTFALSDVRRQELVEGYRPAVVALAAMRPEIDPGLWGFA